MIKFMELVGRQCLLIDLLGIRKVEREDQKDWWMVYTVGEFRRGKRHGKSIYLKDFHN